MPSEWDFSLCNTKSSLRGFMRSKTPATFAGHEEWGSSFADSFLSIENKLVALLAPLGGTYGQVRYFKVRKWLIYFSVF